MAEPEATTTKATLIVVSCGKAKVWDRSPGAAAVSARDAYVSSLFKVCRRYAEATGIPWVILSAKYGFLDPTEPIAQYNMAFGKSQDAIENDALRCQWTERFAHVRRVISLASKAYDARLTQAIGEGVTLETPLKGMGLFQRTGWLQQARLSIRSESEGEPDSAPPLRLRPQPSNRRVLNSRAGGRERKRGLGCLSAFWPDGGARARRDANSESGRHAVTP